VCVCVCVCATGRVETCYLFRPLRPDRRRANRRRITSHEEEKKIPSKVSHTRFERIIYVCMHVYIFTVEKYGCRVWVGCYKVVASTTRA